MRIQKKAAKHKVELMFKGKKRFYKITSVSGEIYTVSIEVNCDCRYMGVQGIANKKVCSHILAALEKVIQDGNTDDQERSVEVYNAG